MTKQELSKCCDTRTDPCCEQSCCGDGCSNCSTDCCTDCCSEKACEPKHNDCCDKESISKTCC